MGESAPSSPRLNLTGKSVDPGYKGNRGKRIYGLKNGKKKIGVVL